MRTLPCENFVANFVVNLIGHPARSLRTPTKLTTKGLERIFATVDGARLSPAATAPMGETVEVNRTRLRLKTGCAPHLNGERRNVFHVRDAPVLPLLAGIAARVAGWGLCRLVGFRCLFHPGNSGLNYSCSCPYCRRSRYRLRPGRIPCVWHSLRAGPRR